MTLAWMAWTWPTAAFFLFIFSCIGAMILWERLSPGGAPRHGMLGLQTTRGDRLFVALLGTGYIFLIWLGVMGTPLWGGLAIALGWWVIVFRWV